MDHIVGVSEDKTRRSCAQPVILIVVFLGSLLLPTLLTAQARDQVSGPERPIPILTGNAGFFTSVNGGETGLVPSVTPVLLLPLGDRWLIESRAEFE